MALFAKIQSSFDNYATKKWAFELQVDRAGLVGVHTIEWLVLLRVAPLNPVSAPRMTRAALDPVVVCQSVDVVQYVKVAVLIKPELYQPSEKIQYEAVLAPSWGKQ